MTTHLISALVAELRQTKPFQSLPVMSRPQDALWYAHNDTLHALRLPLYHTRLGKPRPKPKDYDVAIQRGLALLASFARVIGTRQIIVRIEQGIRQAVSFQPRPFGGNWTADHAISPLILHGNDTDPLLDPADTRPTSLEAPTRGFIHLAGQTAVALMNSDPGGSRDGTVTFSFDAERIYPHGIAVWRSAFQNLPSLTVALLPV